MFRTDWTGIELCGIDTENCFAGVSGVGVSSPNAPHRNLSRVPKRYHRVSPALTAVMDLICAPLRGWGWGGGVVNCDMSQKIQ